MRKFLPVFGFFMTLALLGYLQSPYSFLNKDHARMSSIPYEVLLADAAAEESESVSIDAETAEEVGAEEEVLAQNFTLEMILEAKSEVDGYVVETYREYEMYKDKNGNVVKKVPTSNYDYLRYYQ